jgi:hypothetical protein
MELNKQNRVQIEDLMFILRKDPRKYARAKGKFEFNNFNFYKRKTNNFVKLKIY